MKAIIHVLVILCMALPLVAADSPKEDGAAHDALCGQRLQRIASAVRLYTRVNKAPPAKLSDLVTSGLIEDTTIFICPASGRKPPAHREIDERADFELANPGGDVLVRERKSHRADGRSQAISVKGELVWLDGAGKIAGATSSDQSKSQKTSPTDDKGKAAARNDSKTPEVGGSDKPATIKATPGDTPIADGLKALPAMSIPHTGKETKPLWSTQSRRGQHAAVLNAEGLTLSSSDAREAESWARLSLPGDFEIRVEYTIKEWDITKSLESGFGLRFYDLPADVNHRRVFVSDRRADREKAKYVVGETTPLKDRGARSLPVKGDNGAFRIVRQSDVIQFYVWDTEKSAWIDAGKVTAKLSRDMEFGLVCYQVIGDAPMRVVVNRFELYAK